MSDVNVPYGDSASDTATLLLAAAEELDQDPSVVRTVEGGFLVDEDVAKKAGVNYDKPEGDEPEPEPEPEKKSARKSAAKKSSK